MGGNAFNSLLASASLFPRMPPAVYQTLKTRLTSKLSELYSLVAVPIEAPEKKDYGDLDFIVAIPKPQQGLEDSDGALNVPPERVQAALGAKHVIPIPGNRTSHFAVPITHREWAFPLNSNDTPEGTPPSNEPELFCQVDVNVCTDEEEWKRIVFFHSHGDMGMILGLICRNAGLQLGSKGLKIPDPPNPAFDLSSDFPSILQFMGLPTDPPRSPFPTKQAVFEWLGTSRLFHPKHFRSSGPGISKVKPERKMYFEFVRWAERQQELQSVIDITTGIKIGDNDSGDDRDSSVTKDDNKERIGNESIRIEALSFFNKQSTYDNLIHQRLQRNRLKSIWNGHRVREWADMGEYWKGVKLIMDEVRRECGGDLGIVGMLEREGVEWEGEEGKGKGVEVLKRMVLDVHDRLGLQPHSEYASQT